MLFSFQHFDPLTGELPPETAKLADPIVKRMRRLLSDRTPEELERIVLGLNYWFEEKVAPFESRRLQLMAQELENAFTEAERLELSQLSDFDGEGADSLLLLMSEIRPTDVVEGFAVEWPEVFAAFALALLNEAADDEVFYGQWNDKDPWLHDWRILEHVSHYVVSAQRVSALAEALDWGRRQKSTLIPIDEQVRQEVKAQKTLQARLAAKKRHEKTTLAVLELTSIYRARQFSSMRAAAEWYCGTYTGKVAHLAPTNRVRTLAENLSNQLKAKGQLVT